MRMVVLDMGDLEDNESRPLRSAGVVAASQGLHTTCPSIDGAR